MTVWLATTATAVLALACGHMNESRGVSVADGKDARPGTGGAGGNGPVTWEGAPCTECNLGTQVARLVDAASEDCGRILRDAGNASAADCAHAAFQAGRPFTLIVDQAGTDSLVGTAWVFVAGQLHIVSSDSNVCGGGPSCESARCGPRVVSTTCIDPVASSVPMTVFDCTGRAETQTICGPIS